MITLAVLAAGTCLGLSVVALLGVLTGRWVPTLGATPGGKWRRRALRIWAGPYRLPMQRRAHQKRMIIGSVAGVGLWLFTGMPVLGLCAFLAVPGIPWLLGGGQLERASIERLEAIQAWTTRMISLVVTGTGLQQAIIASVGTAPSEILDEVRDLAARLQAGHDPREALFAFADALDDESSDAVVASLLQQLSTHGANLKGALTAITHAMAGEIGDRRDIFSERAKTRSTLKWLTVIIAGVLMVGPLLGEYSRAYATGTGQVVLFGSLGLLLLFLLKARQLTVPGKSTRFLAPAVEDADDDLALEARA